MALFDSYLMIDWSASNKPARGSDSIWLGLYRGPGKAGKKPRIQNPATRTEACAGILEILREEIKAGRRILCGFDFAFGYPAGFAAELPAAGKYPWERAWNTLAELIEDDDKNRNNRFAAAAEINRRVAAHKGVGAGPFWGCPPGHESRDLAGNKTAARASGFSEHRLADRADTGAGNPQSPFKLFGIGSVGGQSLTGIPRVRDIRNARGLKRLARIWPFETGLKPPGSPIVLAEVYPSLLPTKIGPDEVKDAVQVRELARHFAKRDEKGELAVYFNGPTNATPARKKIIHREEGWILGVR